MVERIDRYGRGVESQPDRSCVVCKRSGDDLIQVDISNGYAMIFSGMFCNWSEYCEWKLKFDASRKEKVVAQEGMG